MKKPALKLIVWFSVFFAVLLFAAETHFAQDGKNRSCLAYEPAIVSLNGTLARRAVINASGQRQSIWIVRLAVPVCVAADANNEMNAAVERIAEVQLVFTAEQIRRYRGMVNQKVQLRGTLFAAHTQHHFADVLMIVGEAKKR